MQDFSFNPRAREGRDADIKLIRVWPSGFNPRAREGRDDIVAACTINVDEFQSTRPRGARRGFPVCQ